jgi:F-type H+-transporting ATPase subunit delta
MSSQVVQSYASAFYEMASEAGKATNFLADVEQLIPVFKDPEVVAFFKSPLFSAGDKEKVIEQTVGGKLDATLADFLKLLAKNGRLGLFPQIIDEFKEASSGGKGAMRGEVFSSAELSETEKQNIKAAIEKKLKTQVNLEYKVNPDLIGGIEAKVGSYIIEDSLSSNLRNLNDSLKRSAH